MKKNPKMWYISWTRYGKIASKLAKKIERSGRRYDLVIGIARGGIPIAMVVADELGTKIDIINVKSYTGVAKRIKPKIISTIIGDLSGKSLLLVDDLVDEGATLETVTRHLEAKSPSRVDTAVIFRKPWTRFEPDYCMSTTDRWVVFPWDANETRRLRKHK